MPYLVGERGPEIFVPGGAGRIEAHPAVRRFMEGRGAGAQAAPVVKQDDIHFSLTVQAGSGDSHEIARVAAKSVRLELAKLQREQRGLLSD